MRRNNYAFLTAAVVLFAVLAWLNGRAGSTAGESYKPAAYATIFALFPPVIAIVLALVTKEVYSSLFTGILFGALLYANGNLEFMLNALFYNAEGGMAAKLSNTWNVGILIFLVMLGILVSLMNKVGGSRAFGHWASKNIKTRAGALCATALLGIIIFVDDYFNCLTVGSVMRPVTDKCGISRAKLAYQIDATAAPVCILAPVSSWAAAVTSSVPADSHINGFTMFLHTIPFNFYALGTLFMLFALALMNFDFGAMKLHEDNAAKGDLFTTAERPYGEADKELVDPKGQIVDLAAPVLILIFCCCTGMLYTGGFFNGIPFVNAFASCDASKGLVFGTFVTLIAAFALYMFRGVMTFQEFMDCVPNGFKAMVAPVLILTMAWTLSGMTGLLGAKFYVQRIVAGSASSLQLFLPVIIFLVAFFLAFSTGTSWGTFAILIPIVCNIFGSTDTYQMLVVSIAACLSGAVAGDHCSPISDTTIMASAGAHCEHVNHVTTQLPYVAVVVVCSAVGYLLTGWLAYAFESSLALIGLPFTLILLSAVLFAIRSRIKNHGA
ncbi:MAG: Na+/H+ antiporter NhaC family protein [Synergistaceae bacterium]|nr:Na+/H+ antiporter NhaC family protein [Synergistaceae bacterium]